MLGSKSIIFIVSTILVFCEASILDSLHKCDISDGDCTCKSVQSMLNAVAKTGDPELGIPVLDPIELRHITVYILDMLNLTLVEGKLKHIKDCKVEKMVTDLDKEHGFMQVFCEALTLKGQYEASASNPLVKKYLGGETVNGNGNFKILIGNLRIKLDYYFYVQQQGGDIYIKCKPGKYSYDYDVEKLTFFLDGVRAGTEDISPLVISLLNKNWKSLKESFGKTFTDKAMNIAYDYIHQFFDTVPCKHYISNDLTKYAKP